jgi:hypothetical protein
MPTSDVDTKVLPENAYQPLHRVEFYLPFVPNSARPPESHRALRHVGHPVSEEKSVLQATKKRRGELP